MFKDIWFKVSLCFSVCVCLFLPDLKVITDLEPLEEISLASYDTFFPTPKLWKLLNHVLSLGSKVKCIDRRTIGWLWIVRIVGCCRGVFLNVLLLHIRTFEWRDYKGTEVKKDGSYLYSEELEAVSHCCNYLSWLSQVSDPTRSSRACDSLQ